MNSTLGGKSTLTGKVLNTRAIIYKTLQIAGATMLSRALGVVREILTVKYLGAGAVADAFHTAYKIPNSLRKIFAEGALSAAFIPTLVGVVRDEQREHANNLMMAGFLVFEGIVLALCAAVIIWAEQVIRLIAAGFSDEKIALAVPFLKILMPFIFFLSSSALLAGALQAVSRFFVPAFSSTLLNIVFIASLYVCMREALPVEYLCWGILAGGLLQFIMHIKAYYDAEFAFGRISYASLRHLAEVLNKFVPCLVSMSFVEVSLFIDTTYASYLPDGSISLQTYGNRFMNIPLGVFAVALSTILLPHLSRVSSYAPKRLSFYLLETAKLVLWVTLPAMLMMSFFARDIFATLFLSAKFPMSHVHEAAAILIAYVSGLAFFSLNKILLNMYYAMHATWIPAIISLVATAVNIFFNSLLITRFGTVGLAVATTISAATQTALFLLLLQRQFGFKFYAAQVVQFLMRYSVQLLVLLTAGWLCYLYIHHFIMVHNIYPRFFIEGVGLWLWVMPLCFAVMTLAYITRRWCGIDVHFLDYKVSS